MIEYNIHQYIPNHIFFEKKPVSNFETFINTKCGITPIFFRYILPNYLSWPVEQKFDAKSDTHLDFEAGLVRKVVFFINKFLTKPYFVMNHFLII